MALLDGFDPGLTFNEDVMSLRGIYHGDAESGGPEVGVKMSRSALDPYTMRPRPVYVRRQEQQQQQQQQ